MLRDMSIKYKLSTAFGLIIGVIIVVLGLAYKNFSSLVQANGLDRHTMEVLIEINTITDSVLQVQSSTRGFMLTGEEKLTAPINAERQSIGKRIAHVRNLTSDNPNQQERLKRLEPMLEEWLKNVIEPLLEKRRELGRMGVSLANLLITVVRKPDGEGHAVLTVRTDKGDYVLDNLNDKVEAWDQTGYRFLKRQAIDNTGRWVSIRGGQQVLVGAVQ